MFTAGREIDSPASIFNYCLPLTGVSRLEKLTRIAKMNDPGPGDPIANDAEAVDNLMESDERNETEKDLEVFLEPRWVILKHFNGSESEDTTRY